MSLQKPTLAVIGAGASGLYAAGLAARKGYSVHLFEKHKLPGGCAGWYGRSRAPMGPLSFDAGATVLNGLSAGSFLDQMHAYLKWPQAQALGFESLQEIFIKLSAKSPMQKIRVSSAAVFIQDLVQVFAKDAAWIQKQFPQWIELAHALLKVSNNVVHLPLERPQDFWLNQKVILAAAPHLFTVVKNWRGSFESLLTQSAQPHGGISAELRAWIDMTLLITTQCRAEAVYAPLGILGMFFYLLDAGTCKGGMRGLMSSNLQQLQNTPFVKVSLGMRVNSIQKIDRKLRIVSEKTKEPGAIFSEDFDIVLSSLPRFNTYDLAQMKPKKHLNFEKIEDGLWGAFTGYLGIEDLPEFPAHAFNVHSKIGTEASEGCEVFISFSRRNDLDRAPSGFRSVTLSTHTQLKPWKNFERKTEPYLTQKADYAERLKAHLLAAFPQVKIGFEEFGSPLTFERYTLRKGGTVGGLPMSKNFTLWNAGSQRTPLKNLYQIGDTSFPGQSVMACAQGAAAVVEKIRGHKLAFNE